MHTKKDQAEEESYEKHFTITFSPMLTLRAVVPKEALIADTLSIHTPSVSDTVVGAALDAAVVAGEVAETHALPIHTVALVVAVVRTQQLAAVVARVAGVAHALPVHAATVVVALVRTGGDGAVGPLPAGVTLTAARVVLVRPMTAAACVHTWGRSGEGW